MRLPTLIAVFATALASGASARCYPRPSSSSRVPPSSSVAPSSSVISSAVSSSAVFSSSASPSSSIVPSSSSAAPASPTLPCEAATGFLVEGKHLSLFNLGTGISTSIKNEMESAIDALAYNALDGYLYGYDAEAGWVVRIDGNGAITQVTSPSLAGPFTMGTIDNLGHYWLSNGGLTGLQIDLVPGSVTYGSVLWSSSEVDNLGYTITDWAFHPFASSEYLFAVASDASDVTSILAFEKISKLWSVQRSFTSGPFADQWGPQYAFKNQNAIYATDEAEGYTYKFPFSGDAVQISRTAIDSPNDGASCIAAAPPPEPSVD